MFLDPVNHNISTLVFIEFFIVSSCQNIKLFASDSWLHVVSNQL